MRLLKGGIYREHQNCVQAQSEARPRAAAGYLHSKKVAAAGSRDGHADQD